MSNIDACCSEPREASKASKPREYKVRFTLNREKTWNKDIQKFLFLNPNTLNDIVVSENQNIEMGPVNYMWRLNDMLTDGTIDSLTYTVI